MKAVRSAVGTKGENYVKKMFGAETLTAIAARGIFDHVYPEDVVELHKYLSERDRLYKWDDIVDKEYKKFIKCGDGGTVDYVKSLYDAEILEFDTEIIGPLISKLKETGAYDKTIIIVASDHGDEFCEHGGMGHGQTPYDEVIRVPLIVRLPWRKGGSRVSDLTMTIDLLPTLLDILGIDSPKYVQGASLKRVLHGQGGDPARSTIMANYPPNLLTYRDKEWKFVLRGEAGRQLFDLKSDPGERHDVVLRHPELAELLETRVRQWKASLPSYGIDRPFLPNIDEPTKEKIKKTGYW